MFNLKIDIHDNSKLVELKNKMKSSYPVMNQIMAKIIKKSIEDEVLKFKKYGTLFRSWRIQKLSRASKVYSTAPHAEIQDSGGPVVAVRAQKLIIPKSRLTRNIIHARLPGLWFSPTTVRKKHKFTSEFLAARKPAVNLPGHHYMDRAVIKGEKNAVTAVRKEIQRIIRETGG